MRARRPRHPRIDLHDAGVLVNDLGLVIAEPIELVRDPVVVRLADDDAHQFLAAELNAADAAIGVRRRDADTRKDRS